MSIIENKSSYTIPDAGLEKFTNEEALDSVLKKATKFYHSIDGSNVFQYWIIQVEDRDGNLYEWRDFSLSQTATKATIKSAIQAHLTTNVDKIPSAQLNEIVIGVNNSSTEGSGTQGVGNALRDNATL